MPVEINDDLVTYIARLSRLALEGGEVPRARRDFERMVRYVEKLEELDTSDVEPSIFTLDLSNILRDDVSRTSLPVEEALSNGPQVSGGYFRVPRIIPAGGVADDDVPMA